MRSPTVILIPPVTYIITNKLLVYNIFNEIIKNNLTSYIVGGTMPVTQAVTKRERRKSYMVNVRLLRAYMVKAGYTQKSLAKELGITEQTLTRKLKRRVFGTDEAAKIVSLLEIDNPEAVFFSD